MKLLYIMRHAQAEMESATGRDFDRPLARRGWDDAVAVGREALARGLRIGLVLASPARRALETVEAFQRGYGSLEVEFDQGIYDAPVSRLFEIVGGQDDAIDRLLIVGHNPGFEGLAVGLTTRSGEGFRGGMPTAGLAAIELAIEHWIDLREGSGRMTDLIVPRDL